jgi:hypothetical protein
MYWDAVDGTTTWVDEISRIKVKYPKVICAAGESNIPFEDEALAEKTST